jgi:hypothetical protein
MQMTRKPEEDGDVQLAKKLVFSKKVNNYGDMIAPKRLPGLRLISGSFVRASSPHTGRQNRRATTR